MAERYNRVRGYSRPCLARLASGWLKRFCEVPSEPLASHDEAARKLLVSLNKWRGAA